MARITNKDLMKRFDRVVIMINEYARITEEAINEARRDIIFAEYRLSEIELAIIAPDRYIKDAATIKNGIVDAKQKLGEIEWKRRGDTDAEKFKELFDKACENGEL